MQEVPRKNKPSYPVPAGKPIVPTPGMKLKIVTNLKIGMDAISLSEVSSCYL